MLLSGANWLSISLCCSNQMNETSPHAFWSFQLLLHIFFQVPLSNSEYLELTERARLTETRKEYVASRQRKIWATEHCGGRYFSHFLGISSIMLSPMAICQQQQKKKKKARQKFRPFRATTIRASMLTIAVKIMWEGLVSGTCFCRHPLSIPHGA